jgi:hypothetical protein
MEMNYPHVRTIPLKCAPGKAPCPRCGKLGNRKAIHHRRVRTIAYKQVVCLDITYGEYRARCDCCTTFRTTPPGVEPRALYDNKVREAVLDRILEDGMSVERVIASMGRDGSSVFWCEHPGICGPSYWARAVFPGISTYPRKIRLSS